MGRDVDGRAAHAPMAEDGRAALAPPYRRPALARVSEEQRRKAWELHLRGLPKVRIAEQLGINRRTVIRIVAECYAEVSEDRRAQVKRKLELAILRMRYVQQRAWADYDEDDARERRAVQAALAAGAKGGVHARYRSQRARLLRVILDAEKEIARLEGLYQKLPEDDSEVVFRLERVSVAVPAGSGESLDGGLTSADR